MPMIYVNGGSPAYTGYQFTTSTQIIDAIETNLVSAGWTSLKKTAGVSVALKGLSIVGNFPCYVEFKVITNSSKTNGKYLVVRGFHDYSVADQLLSAGSTDNFLQMEFIEGSINRLWLTADQEAGCFCIYSSDGTCKGMHFGFLDRIDTNDQWAWMVGLIHTNGYSNSQVAKAKHNSVAWRILSNDYLSNGDFNSWQMVLPITTFDLVKRGSIIGSDSNWGYTGNPIGAGEFYNVFYNAHLGGRNYNSRAVIDKYCYVEGRGATNNYTASTLLYYRGPVKFAHCGVASEAAASIALDLSSNKKILSTGASGWQGMEIDS